MSADKVLQPVASISTEPGTVLAETDRLIVRRFLLSDAESVAAVCNNAAVAARLRDRFPSPYGVADAESFISHCLSAPTAEAASTATPEIHGPIVLKPLDGDAEQQPRIIGIIGATPKTDINYRTWEVGYFLAEDAWGHGYATEALGAFVRSVFASWPRLHRLEAWVFSSNQASRNVLKKCGFLEEGRRRGAVEKQGMVMDEVMLGLLRTDLPA